MSLVEAVREARLRVAAERAAELARFSRSLVFELKCRGNEVRVEVDCGVMTEAARVASAAGLFDVRARCSVDDVDEDFGKCYVHGRVVAKPGWFF